MTLPLTDPFPQNCLINEVLDAYLQLRNGGAGAGAKSVALCDQILSSYTMAKSRLEAANKTDGNLFNPLQSIGIGETIHSVLVGGLLHPHGSHGQGSLFLESFLRLIGVPDPDCGKWAVTVERGRVDILLRRLNPHSIVIIENKSNGATDQPNQLYRYWHRMIHEPFPKLMNESHAIINRFKIVYLTPRLSKEPTGNTLERPAECPSMKASPKSVPNELVRIVTFRELINNWLTDPKVTIPKANSRLSIFLQFYYEIWQHL